MGVAGVSVNGRGGTKETANVKCVTRVKRLLAFCGAVYCGARDCVPIGLCVCASGFGSDYGTTVPVYEACYRCCNLSPDAGRRMQRVLLVLIRRPLKGLLARVVKRQIDQTCIPAIEQTLLLCVL